MDVVGESEEDASARKVGETVRVERQRSLASRQGAEPPSNRPARATPQLGRMSEQGELPISNFKQRRRWIINECLFAVRP